MTSLSQRCNHLTIVTVLYNFYMNTCPTSVADSIYGDSWQWGNSECNPLSNVTDLCIIKAELKCIKFAKWQVVCEWWCIVWGVWAAARLQNQTAEVGKVAAERLASERVVWLSALNEHAWFLSAFPTFSWIKIAVTLGQPDNIAFLCSHVEKAEWFRLLFK